MAGVTQAQLEMYLEALRGREVHINTIMRDLRLDNDQAQDLRVLLCGRLRERRFTKPSGKRDGWFKVLRDVKPIRIGNVNPAEVYDFAFPSSYNDYTSFGFEELMTVSPGDLIVIAGRSNAGKSAIAHSILGENIPKHECVLMGNEVVGADGFIMPKFYRRLKRMEWAQMFNGDGELNFELLPVGEDYEDYIRENKLNIIDWISIPKDVWMIGSVLDAIKKSVGKGVAVAVLQKKKDVDYGYGGEPTEHYADVYMKIDRLGNWESRLTLGKIKEPKGRVTGRMWGFEIIDGGANLTNIREIKPCQICKGRGSNYNKDCDNCIGKGYVDK